MPSITIYVPRDIWEKLEEDARAEGVMEGKIVRRILEQHYRQREFKRGQHNIF
ncbi:MAG: hypothetical protein DSO04_04245 [Hadesarchaea archaeon]|nr:MAG: hypothetical protein DSO04_04245 [Hadesarchaea archaeon]